MAGCVHRDAAADWGLQCMRYEIRDISPPTGVRAAMELQVRPVVFDSSTPPPKSVQCLSQSRRAQHVVVSGLRVLLQISMFIVYV